METSEDVFEVDPQDNGLRVRGGGRVIGERLLRGETNVGIGEDAPPTTRTKWLTDGLGRWCGQKGGTAKDSS